MTRFRRSTVGAAALAAMALIPASGWADVGHHGAAADATPSAAQGELRLAHMGGGQQGMTGQPGMAGPQGMMRQPGMMGQQGMGGPQGMMGDQGRHYREMPCQDDDFRGGTPGMMGSNMMGGGMMGPGMMGQGGGQGMGPGMMGQGMGPGMMQGGMMGGMMQGGMMGQSGTMGRGMAGQRMGPGMMDRSAPGFPFAGERVTPDRDLGVDDVRHYIRHRLEAWGNKRLALGDVTETDEDTITADINTVDGSLVERLAVDRHTGQMRMAE